jgi:hypothetical protein
MTPVTVDEVEPQQYAHSSLQRCSQTDVSGAGREKAQMAEIEALWGCQAKFGVMEHYRM